MGVESENYTPPPRRIKELKMNKHIEFTFGENYIDRKQVDNKTLSQGGEISEKLLDMVLRINPLYIVYQFYNANDECVYVGQSVDFYSRLWKHIFNTKESCIMNESVLYIKFYYCKTKADMCLTESYFIKKLRPRKNTRLKKNDRMTFEIKEIENQENEIVPLDILLTEWVDTKTLTELALPETYKKVHWRNFNFWERWREE